jgi:hypothetical protein
LTIVLVCTALLLSPISLGISDQAGEGRVSAAAAATDASKRYRTFSEAYLKSLPLTGGYYSCLKQQPPYTYFWQDWYGVRLAYLLDEVVGLCDNSTGISVYARDSAGLKLGWDFSLDRVRNPNNQGLYTILAWQKGTPGAPHREPPLTPLTEAEDGVFRLALGQSPTVGPFDQGGEPNFDEFAKWVRTIAVLPLPAGVTFVNPATVPAGQIMVYGNIRTMAINSIGPTYGLAGTKVTISGYGFGTSRGSSYVSFESVAATDYISWSDTQIRCTVPTGVAGPVKVTVTKPGETSNAVDFSVSKEPPSVSSTFYFAEGTCRPGFDPYLCVQNPGSSDAAVTVTYMKGDGTTDSESLTVPKNARSTVTVKNKLGEGNDPAHDFSCKVECTNGQNIIAERPMYFNYQGAAQYNWAGGHDVVGYTP